MLSSNTSIKLVAAHTSDHLAQQTVDLVLAVAKVAAVDVVVGLLAPAAGGRVELEGPQEVGGVLEVGANGEDLVDEILDALNVVRLTELALDHKVVGDGHTLTAVLHETALVDQRAHRLQVGVAPGDVGLGDAEHVNRGLVQLDEHTVVDLAQAEKLEDLADLGRHLVDTRSERAGIRVGLFRWPGRDVTTHPRIRTTKASLASAGT